MSIFDKASRKVSETVKDLQKKTNESMAIKRLESQIKAADGEIDGLYKAIGESAYNLHIQGAAPEGLEELFAGVTALKERAVKLNDEIDKLNGIRRCPNCAAQVERLARFCPHCGTKLEEIVDEPEPEESDEEVPVAETCPDCGTLRKNGMQFCEICGHDFESSPVQASAPDETPEPEEEPARED